MLLKTKGVKIALKKSKIIPWPMGLYFLGRSCLSFRHSLCASKIPAHQTRILYGPTPESNAKLQGRLRVCKRPGRLFDPTSARPTAGLTTAIPRSATNQGIAPVVAGKNNETQRFCLV